MLRIIVLIATLSISSTVFAALPCQKPVTLDEFTRLSIDLIPHLGTRLIFPFILNDESEIIPFDIKITNAGIFNAARSKDTTHNTVLLSVNSDAWQQSGRQDYIGSAFITVAGYNVTIRLNTTVNMSKHCDDIIFQLTDKDREYLIDYAVKSRLEQYDSQYKDKLQDIDKMAESKSRSELGEIALEKPSSRNVKEVIQADFDGGGRIEAYIDKFLKYSNTNILVFELENRTSKTLDVQSIELTKTDDGQVIKVYDSAYHCDKAIYAGDKKRCALIVDSNEVYKDNELTLQLSTNKGQVGFKW